MGMGRVAEKAVSFGPSLRRLIGQLKPEKPLVIFVIAMGAISVVFNVVNPKIMGRATDAIFAGVIGKQFPAGMTVEQVVKYLREQGQNQLADMLAGINGLVPGQGIDFHRLGVVLLTVIGLYVAASLLSFLQSYLLNRIVQRSVFRMREAVVDKIDRLPLSYFDKQPRGELLSRVTNDIDNIQQSLQQTLSQLMNSVLMIIGVTAMMFTVSWSLALITLCILPFSAVVSAFIGKKAQKRFVGMWTATGELNGQVEEAYTGHALVKTFGRRAEVDAQFDDTNKDLYKAAFGANFLSVMLMPINGFIGNLNYVVVAVLGGLRVANGTMALGDVQAFIQYSRMFTQPIGQVASMANLLQSGVASAERVFEVLDSAEQSPDATGTLPEPIAGHVEFANVDFSYSADKPLIEGLNIEAKPGQTVAIVGPTGAGKTTLVNLLMRFYEVDKGAILLDGTDITSVPRAELRDQFGMVLQDTWLFGGTIYDNIAYGAVDATHDQVMEAAKTTYVDRFVAHLPDGYNTVIDEEGSNISAGEKQLLTIARAFVSDPVVLILDEATSSVDTRTEVLVQHAMAKLRSGRTSFVIAHRLSTIRDADVILVMQHGSIVEQGTHDELVAAHGAYWELYNAQFAGMDD
jgi:ATP-binding cassette subfamily B protein